ncbi:isochorismatase family protein [uncultured Cardiobacterium sp.]|uniref:isochorismatase family protein n=1 Tax=uncultured Cardiobacterium sp. TaxID=417619 RepID=UPI002631239A|nr:isochorismatase family protein [uncultured Cardiobacterium sp.]
MYQPFSSQDAVMLLIDHQVGTMSWVGSIPFEDMKRNALMLAKSAAALGIPTVLTSSMEEHAQGPLLAELGQILPKAFANRVKRAGIVNAMADPNFATAVKAAAGDRKRIIIAGVTNDVCTVYPTLTLLEMGYEVQVVADAGGSPSAIGDELSLRRIAAAGATVVGTNQLIAELAQDWSSADGQKLLAVVAEALQGEKS